MALVSGIVNPYGKIFNRKATNKLLTDVGKIFLLMGDKKALATLIHRRAKVTGSIIDPRQKYPILRVTTAEAIN